MTVTEEMGATPWWSTATKMRLSEGRVVGVDGSVWAYRSVPMVPVVDARTEAKKVDALSATSMAMEELARMASATAGRRALNKGSYREVHFLSVCVPSHFNPPRSLANARELVADFGHLEVKRRAVVMGVKLRPHIRREGMGPVRSAIESVAESLTTGGIPLVEFDDDFRSVDAAMTRSGLMPASREELDLVSAWWNFGHTPDTPVLVHADHLHVFTTTASSQAAARADQTKCAQWDFAGQYPLTFATVSSFETEWLPVTDNRVLWGSDLHADGALAVSVRALVEPAKVTAGEMRRHIKQYESDIEERVSQGKKTKADQQHDLNVLREVEAQYSVNGGVPTLHNAQITVALDQIASDLSAAIRSDYLQLGSLAFRQRAAMSEQMIGSPVRANPSLQDLPVQAVTGAGLNSLSTVGDPDGALLGLTENDRQPAYVSPSAVSDVDGLPFFVIAGATGSGKTMAMLHLARQWAMIPNRRGERTPVIFVDPKQDSDFSEPVERLGGQVFSLDDLTSAGGVFDPIRVLGPQVGVETAVAMLGDIDPWGGRTAHEVPLLKALSYGAANGGTCIGHALDIALQAGQVSRETAQPIEDLLDASPLFRAIFGKDAGGTSLRNAQGITLIKAGSQQIPLPERGEMNPGIVKRIGQWVLRMMVYGSAAAVQGRQGVVMLDEAWQFLLGQSGAGEVQRLGRLARSMQVLPVLASQRLDDFVKAELGGYIGRGLILQLDGGTGERRPDGSVDNGQAGVALDLFKISKSDARVARISASQFIEGTRRPNWFSLKALRDEETGKHVRGSIGFYIDLSGRAIPVEITVPPAFLKEISTSAGDMAARELERQGRAVP